MRESRRLKPEIPEFAADGTPIEDEIEFELLLEGRLTSEWPPVDPLPERVPGAVPMVALAGRSR